MTKALSFAVAGGVGFVVDAGILTLLLAATPLDPFSARLVSILTALSSTWFLNRNLTFGPSGRSLASEGARYGGVGAATSIVNYLIYSVMLIAFPHMPPLVALIAASGAAMVLSYFGYTRLVFNR
jgi:putative flippase GtrA